MTLPLTRPPRGTGSRDQEPGQVPGRAWPGRAWPARVRAAVAARPRPAAVALLTVCALFACGLAAVSGNPPQRWWGLLAAGSYGLAATAALAWPRHGIRLAVLISAGGALIAQPGTVAVNTILFPLGLTKIHTPAASYLPGHLIAQAWGWGHWAAITLVLLAGLAVAASLIARPPRDAQAAGWRLVIGLALMFVFAPATRFGYAVYPLTLSAWLLLPWAASAAVPASARRPGPDRGDLRPKNHNENEPPARAPEEEEQRCWSRSRLPHSGSVTT